MSVFWLTSTARSKRFQLAGRRKLHSQLSILITSHGLGKKQSDREYNDKNGVVLSRYQPFSLPCMI
jgi:hypothetical protein